MTRRDEVTTLHGTFGRETDKAVQFTPDGGEATWFPLSQVKSMHRIEGRIVVTTWIARQKDLA